jgi:hypothetical protein
MALGKQSIAESEIAAFQSMSDFSRLSLNC